MTEERRAKRVERYGGGCSGAGWPFCGAVWVLMRFERVYNEGLPKGFIRFMISFKCILSYSIVSFA